MFDKLKQAILSISIVLGLTTSTFAKNITEEIAALANEHHTNHHFVGSLLVAQKDQILFETGYGLADATQNQPNTSTTQHLIASVTKQFVAALTLKLAEQGKLDLEKPIKEYLPQLPAWAQEVTCHQILSHTSGIPKPDALKNLTDIKAAPRQVSDLLKLLHLMTPSFQPGQGFEYSNPGYIVLGAILEKVSGKPFDHLLHEEILDPYGLENTFFASSGLTCEKVIHPRAQEIAIGYSYDPDHPDSPYQSPQGKTDLAVVYSAGALFSTVHDLYKWNKLLFSGKVLQAASLEKMLTPVKTDEKGGYGYGIWVSTSPEEEPHYKHAGNVDGYRSILFYEPKSDTTIAILSNSERCVESLANELYNLVVSNNR